MGYSDKSKDVNNIVLGDMEKTFLEVGIKQENREASYFLFKVNEQEEQFRFTRVPFGAEVSPFILGATLQHHYDQQREHVGETVQTLRDNTMWITS